MPLLDRTRQVRLGYDCCAQIAVIQTACRTGQIDLKPPSSRRPRSLSIESFHVKKGGFCPVFVLVSIAAEVRP